MTKSLAEIRDSWAAAATLDRDADGLRPTARDPNLQQAVETAIERWLRSGDRLLDVGCGDGLSTLRFAGVTGSAVGVDYIEEFVTRARQHAAKAGARAEFRTANVMDLAALRRECGLFDAITCIRCLINLATAENQRCALGEIAACLRPGGLFLISEGWADGMAGLNLMRQRARLPAIEVVAYNLLIDRGVFEAAAAPYFDLVGYHGLGLFLYLSRVAQPLLVAPQPPSHTHRLNEIAVDLQAAVPGDDPFPACDYAGVYVFRRKADRAG